MRIIIEIKDKKVKLSLKKGKEELDSLNILDEYRLSEDLLPAIDKLLKKNKLKPENIRKIDVKTDQTDNFTTTRIAKAVAETWNWALGKSTTK